MIVPARYRLANRLKPRGLSDKAPRKPRMKVMKKQVIRMTPNFQEKTFILEVSGTILSCSSSSCAELLSLRRELCVEFCKADVGFTGD